MQLRWTRFLPLSGWQLRYSDLATKLPRPMTPIEFEATMTTPASQAA